MTASEDPEDPIPALRSRVRGLIWWFGVSCCLTALCGGLVIAGWCDWWLRIEDPGLRLLLAMTVWGVVAVTIWRTLIGPLRAPLSDVYLAEQVERRYPGFSGRISSAMAFRSSGFTPRHGSPQLQRLLAAQADEELSRIDPGQIVTAREIRPATLAGVGTALLAALLLLAFPLEAATAVRRLVWPWGENPWPQAVVLRLLTKEGTPADWDPQVPRRVVRGDAVELLVENARGRLPEQVWLETRLEADDVPLRELLQRPPTSATSKPAPERAALALAAVRGPLEFRVVGGDDRSMPWRTLDVVEPPTLASYEVHVTSPAYTRQAMQVLPTGATQIRGWLGSRVQITATATRPLQSATLQGRDRTPEPLQLSSDGLAWIAEFVIAKPDPTAIWFELRDPQGFAEREPLQFEVRGDIDALPQVTLREPAADLVVTPAAEVPLVIEARDDLGVNALRLVWQKNDSEPETASMFDYSDPRLEVAEAVGWKLSELALVPGDRVIFRVEATDACDLGAEHVAKSAPRTLLVATDEDKRAELQARAGELVEDLRDAADLQTRLRDQTTEVQTQLETTGRLRRQDRDVLNRVELDQRNLAARLSDGATSLSNRAEQLQDEFRFNHLADPETEAGLEQLATQLRELTQSTTVELTRELTQASKLLANSTDDKDNPPEDQPATKSPEAKPAAEALEQATRHQSDVIDTLSELQSLLAEWRGQRDIGRQLSSLAEEQQRIGEATAELGAQTVAKSTPELTPQQQADLSKLAAQQRRQAERIQQLQKQLEQLKEDWADQNPDAAEAAADAAERLDESQAATQARQAANDITANRLGPASELQRAVQESLSELQQEWDARQPDDAEQLVERLQNLQNEADQLTQDQEQLRKKSEAPSADDAQVAEETAELRRRAQRLERQLQRMRMNRAADTARRAAEHLRRAEDLMDNEDDPEQLRKEQDQAAEDLEQLQQELAQERRSAEERLAQEAMEKVAQALEALAQRQSAAIAETERLDQEWQARGQWTRGQLRSLKDLADTQRELVGEAEKVAKQLEVSTILHAAMQHVVGSMTAAADRLAERQADAITRRAEQDAVRRLQQLLSAWNTRPEPPTEPMPDEQQIGEPQQNQNAGPPGESVSLQVQLRLLRNWQADCLERTTAWHADHPDPKALSESEQAELTRLADEQGELAKLAQDLIDTLQSSRPQTPAAQPQPKESP